ncbi:MAG: helix-turn-helix domain-containing protein [Microbacterium sp.]|uniref:TetR/AcrR family transcriptional regulator n=1 Tax=Microbacterium sp. TaxID=51671 RepID=UPI0039E4895F
MSTQTSPRKDAVANRAALLDAARGVVARDPRASMDTIARAAGLSRRALYGHFPDRDALVAELIRTGTGRFNDLAAGIDDTDAPLALAGLTHRLWTAAAQVQVVAALALDDAHVAETAAALAPVRRRLAGIVAAGQAAGTLRTDIPAPDLTRLIEETARMAITRLDADAGRTAVAAVLGVAGLSWQQATDLIAQHPELTDDPDRTGVPTPTEH